MTTLTSGLLALFLGRRPFTPPYLTFVRAETYHRWHLLILPLYGIGIWLFMSAVAHLALRLAGRPSSYDLVLKIIGVGMLAPVLLTWPWDWVMLVPNRFSIIPMAVSHTLVQLWEAGVQALGFKRVMKLRTGAAIALAIAVNILYILGAATLMR